MALSSVYSKYFQKSKVFLYPLLGIKRGTSVIPTETYLSWNDTYTPEDMKLVCVYHRREDAEYIQFEKNILLKHTRLNDFIIVNDSTTVVIFDFSDLSTEWSYFLNGKYSKLDLKIKHQILSFFDKHSGNYSYMHSYLLPEKHFSNYADLLGVDINMLIEVGELCSKPDFEKEKLIMAVADLENIETKLNL
jgi:hypothetical protein